MDTNQRTIAATELVLIFPGALFMTALFVRYLQPLQSGPAHTAERIVMWYADRVWTLWILLIGLPLAVLVIGCITLLQGWRKDTDLRQTAWQQFAVIRSFPAALTIAAAIVAAGGILAVVALHMLAN